MLAVALQIFSLPARESNNEHWMIDSLGAPHIGQRSERELIASFVNRVAELSPQTVIIGHDGWADGRFGDYEVQILPNLQVLTGAAEYGKPAIGRVLNVG